jgi:hypothetical protein
VSKKLLTVQIESLVVFSNGDVPGALQNQDETNKRNVLTATLLYPRSGAPNIASVLQFNLQNHQSPAFDLGDFFKSGLFKEEVLDETILQININDRDIPGNIDKAMLKIFTTLLAAGLGVATAGIGTILGAVTGLAINTITASIGKAGEEAKVCIAQTEPVRLTMDKLTDQPLRMVLAFHIPEAIEKPYLAIENGQAVRKTMRLEKGTPNGQITLLMSAKPTA